MSNQHTYLYFKTDGTWEKIVTNEMMELKQMQELVGGYIETLSFIDVANLLLVFNEEGRLKNLPVNPFFSQIVGNCFMCRRLDEDMVGLNEQQIKLIVGVINQTLQYVRESRIK